MKSRARSWRGYAGMASLAPRVMLAHRSGFWLNFVNQAITLAVLVPLWSAAYRDHSELGGLSFEHALGYVLAAQAFWNVGPEAITPFSQLLRHGQLAIELLRPLDLQLRFYVEAMVGALILVVQRLCCVGVAWALVGLPAVRDPLVCIAFGLSAFLGLSILFLVQWLALSLIFYTVNSWGLASFLSTSATFLGGGLLPLELMAPWARRIAEHSPFAHCIYAPASILSGIVGVGNIPQVLLGQAAWLVALLVCSRIGFAWGMRRVTIQGG